MVVVVVVVVVVAVAVEEVVVAVVVVVVVVVVVPCPVFQLQTTNQNISVFLDLRPAQIAAVFFGYCCRIPAGSPQRTRNPRNRIRFFLLFFTR